LLVLFCIGTVHAATMGMAMPISATQDTAAMHCHEPGDEAGHGDTHIKPHPGHACVSCAACVPMMLSEAAWRAAPGAASEKNPHREASYASFISKLLHRPPIFA